jgi:peptide/nickel transport system ATP-binding protein
MPPEPLLEIRDLSVTFPRQGEQVKVVDAISFDIGRGETVGLVGESGSGKSVTSLSLMRLLPPEAGAAGRIRFHGGKGDVDLMKLQEERMRGFRGRKLAMVFQEPMSSLNPAYSCGEQVAEAVMLHLKVSRARAEARVLELFRQVQLPEPEQMLRRYPHQLSGGQKQRVMIAMAISCRPDLVIADEPTTALDVTVQQAILRLLKELQRDLGISVLFITHDLGVVAEIADRVMVMYKGRLVEQGAVGEVFTHPRHPYTKGLLACRPPLDRKLSQLPVIADFMEEKAGGPVARETDITALLDGLETDPAVTERRRKHMEQSGPVLQVRDLTVRFPGKKNFLGKPASWTLAVDRVSFDVAEGETLGLVGESGCGKTTLSRAILRLITPSEGQVLYRGADLCTLDDKSLRRLRSKIQIIFQDPYSSLNPRLTVGQAILEPMQVHGLYGNDRSRRLKARELLEKVTLQPEYFDRYPHEFSGGQRQRVGIARALALEPEFLIFDESVSALDVSVQAQVLNLLLRLREEYRFSSIFISHDLSVVRFMCDRIMVMNRGRLEESGPADEIYAHPRSAYTRRLIDAIPRPHF